MPSFMNRLKKLALKSQCGFKLGSIIMRGGRTLSEGFNKWSKTHAIQREFSTRDSIHAEIDAIRKLGMDRLKGSTLYVGRIGKNGDFRLSKPCPVCQKVISNMGISKVVYSVDYYPFFIEERVV